MAFATVTSKGQTTIPKDIRAAANRKPMLGIDTNVVVRLIVSDDAEQTRRARKLVGADTGP